MKIEVLKSKIHRVSVTGADLNYIGSITIDEELMEAANLVEGERVFIVNINNGERFDTYVIKGNRKSGDIILNGPAALATIRENIVLLAGHDHSRFRSTKRASYFEEAKTFKPTIIFPDEKTNLLK